MNDTPRQQLIQLIATYGFDLCDDPRQCEGLLRDHCGEYNLEIILIINALHERITEDLLKTQEGEPFEVLIGRLSERLQTNRGLSKDAAIWAVETWAIALGIIEESLLKKEEDLGDEGITTISESVSEEDRTEAKESSVNEIIVSLAGDGDCLSINEAIKDSSGEDRIIIKPGWYRENITIDKSINLIGEGNREEIILEDNGDECIFTKAKLTEISNLTLRSSPGNEATLLNVHIGKIIISNCLLFPSKVGIQTLYDFDTEVYLSKSKIEGGSYHIQSSGGIFRITDSDLSSSRDTGLIIWGKSNFLILNSKLSNSGRNGIYISKDVNISLENCQILDGNMSGISVWVKNNNIRLTMRNCDINRNNKYAIHHDLLEEGNLDLEVTNSDLRYNTNGPSKDDLKDKLSGRGNKVDYQSNDNDEKDSAYDPAASYLNRQFSTQDQLDDSPIEWRINNDADDILEYIKDREFCSNCHELVKPMDGEWGMTWCPKCNMPIRFS